jgi:hypothetical protein
MLMRGGMQRRRKRLRRRESGCLWEDGLSKVSLYLYTRFFVPRIPNLNLSHKDEERNTKQRHCSSTIMRWKWNLTVL